MSLGRKGDPKQQTFMVWISAPLQNPYSISLRETDPELNKWRDISFHGLKAWYYKYVNYPKINLHIPYLILNKIFVELEILLILQKWQHFSKILIEIHKSKTISDKGQTWSSNSDFKTFYFYFLVICNFKSN